MPNETEVLQVLRLPRKGSRRPQYPIVAGLLRTSLEVLRVLHLPRKISAPATQTKPACNRRRTSADLSGGAPRAAPARQNETEVLQVLRLPGKNETEVLQVLRLPRRRSRRPQYSVVAGLLRTSLEVLRVLHLPRKMRLKCFKCCACHANTAGVHSIQSSRDFRGPLWRCSD